MIPGNMILKKAVSRATDLYKRSIVLVSNHWFSTLADGTKENGFSIALGVGRDLVWG